MKLSRQEKQEMIDECTNKLRILRINNSYPKEEKMWARFLVLTMEAEVYD